MTGGLWLITSGAYVGQELAAEFGQMPPSFLPVGARRLYEYQLERIEPGATVYLTLPETFEIPPRDLARLHALRAIPLAVPEGMRLGESIVFALNLIGPGDQPVHILHGDTLVDPMPPLDLDKAGVAISNEGYSWAEVELDGDRITGLETTTAGRQDSRGWPVACGYFAFSSATTLVRSITRARGRFIDGILEYLKERPLRAAHIDGWYDFGHVQTFFRSRRFVTTARHFNSLRIDGRAARKTSSETSKIRAEAAWFASVPAPLRVYTARLIDAGDDEDGRAFYETEYAYLPTLAELFVFGAVGPSVWSNILRSCEEFLLACGAASSDESADRLLYELAAAKTVSRLRQFSDATGFDIDGALWYGQTALPSLMAIAENAIGRINFESGRRAHVMHGDFCFSNILYDSRMQRIRVIDPRGHVKPDQPSIHGALRYDLAKFAHSAIGRYDQIIAGRYRLAASDDDRFFIEFEEAPHHSWLEKSLVHFTVDGVSPDSLEVRALTICLFLSMLPVHSDQPERQRAFIANALRLYARMEAEA